MNNSENHDQRFFCMSKRSMSLISSGFIFILFLSFMTGYVWGKRVALEDILKAVEQKTFADQISGSLYAISARDGEKKEDQSEVEPVVVTTVIDGAPANGENAAVETNSSESENDMPHEPANNLQENKILPKKKDLQKISHGNLYYAQLIGFSSKKAADSFVAHLKNSPLEVSIKERTSVGAQGRKKVWYQVITQRYTDKEELERLVAHVAKKEHLSGVQIIPC